MRRQSLRCTLLSTIVLGVALSLSARAEGPPAVSAHAPATVCFPPAWDGLVPGISRDSHARRLYGDGFFSRSGGHGGTRYFLAGDESYTVAVELGVDEIVETVTLSAGIDLPKGVAAAQARSTLLPPKPTIYRVHLGLAKERVRSLLGNPSPESTDDRWVYSTDYRHTDCYPQAGATFTFAHGQLTRMSVFLGD